MVHKDYDTPRQACLLFYTYSEIKQMGKCINTKCKNADKLNLMLNHFKLKPFRKYFY